MADTYKQPEHGWTCFFCGETFTTPGAARDHFGREPGSLAGCQIKAGAERGLLMALRKAEEDAANAWAIIHNDTHDCARAYQAAISRHSDQLMAAEELGYERGLRDAKPEGKEE